MRFLALYLVVALTYTGTRGDSGSNPSQTRKCSPTSADILGPYYYPDPPKRRQICDNDPYFKNWDHLLVQGRVLNDDCETPVAGARIEVWQADHGGHYLFKRNCRGYFFTGRSGHYAFITIHPGKYSTDPQGELFRPAHIHFRVEHPGYNILVTQMYFEGDSSLGKNDSCSTCASSRPDLVVKPKRVCPHESEVGCLHVATFNVVMTTGKGLSVNLDEEDSPAELFDAVIAG